jgi:AraC-like DNA-binding protein
MRRGHDMRDAYSPQRRDGFAGQDMFVIPRPILADAKRHPLFSSLYPTDIGWFPEASHHYRDRPNGAGQDHLMMCIGGHGFADIDGKRCQLKSGELLIIPRNCTHTYWSADDAPWSIYWMHFLGDDADYYVDRIPRRGEPVAVDDASRDEAVRLFRDCLDTLNGGYALPSLIYAAQSARHILSLLLFRNQAFPKEKRDVSRQALLEATTEYMHARLSETVRLDEFAEHVGLSVSRFSELFRNQTGQSPMAYFNHLKIRAACRLLDLTRKPIKVVAIETGYADPYYFSRAFKKVMGLSPENYRAIKKG